MSQTPPRGNGGNGTPNGVLVHILTELLHLHIRHGDQLSRHGETLGRIETKLTEQLTEEKKESKFLSMGMAILGHWGTISALAVGCWKFVVPHVRVLLGL